MRGLKNPVKFYIDLSEFSTKNTEKFINEYGNRLKHMLGVGETDIQIDVSKIWVNQKTYDLFKEYNYNILKKKSSKARAEKEVMWLMLQVAPSCDIDNELNLEDDYYYVEEDYAK